MALRTAGYKIGVVGPNNSGKTVLMTSLINHLMHHHSAAFPLGVEITQFLDVSRSDEHWPAFEYGKHRAKLVQRHEWPDKTTDRSRFECTFRRSDNRLQDIHLTLYDLPGERIADIGMADQNYEDWSKRLLGDLYEDKESYECFAPYWQLLRGNHRAATPESICHAYRIGLARLVHRYKPFISPSTFFLDLDGKMIERGEDGKVPDEEALANSRCIGVDRSQEFAPLPPDDCSGRPELTRVFTPRFEKYRRHGRPTVA